MEKLTLRKSINGSGERKLMQIFHHYIQFALDDELNLAMKNGEWIWYNVDDIKERIDRFLNERECEYVVRIFKCEDKFRLGITTQFVNTCLRTYKNYLKLGIELCRTFKKDAFVYCDGDETVLDDNGSLLSWRSGGWWNDIVKDRADSELYPEPSFFLQAPNDMTEKEIKAKSGEIFIEFE